MTQSDATPYPLTIRAEFAERLDRWLFLIKWLLIIPHVIVLVFLWIGVIFSWLYSMFAILFTGVYPRGPFNYNVKVLRWTWRVGFYSYQALGTDKYPPFTLDKRDDYPADLDVPYPYRLNKGQALFQWWLLAFPHHVILGFLRGGFMWAGFKGFDFFGGGLQFVAVVFGAIGHLFTGKWPDDLRKLAMDIN
jgi:hypothetical protein